MKHALSFFWNIYVLSILSANPGNPQSSEGATFCIIFAKKAAEWVGKRNVPSPTEVFSSQLPAGEGLEVRAPRRSVSDIGRRVWVRSAPRSEQCSFQVPR